MKPPADPVRISVRGKEHLSKLKRQTGIEHWNVLCRWALCCSLRERTVPPRQTPSSIDGGVEMSWKVFAGEYSEPLAALIYHRASTDGFMDSPDGAALCLRAHIQRGLGYMSSEVGDLGIDGFIRRWVLNQRAAQQD